MDLSKPTIVLFDMDGTTVRHINPWLLGLLETIDDFTFFITKFLRKKDSFKLPAPENKRKPRLLAHKALHKVRRKEVDEIVQPCPGIFPVLDFFKEKNIPLGIVSNGLGKGYGHDVLEKFDLDQYFQSAVFREDIVRSKPYPDPIVESLENLKVDNSDKYTIWYIGDRRKDILAAIHANSLLNCSVVPFSYGIDAAVAILEKGIGQEHIIVNYEDFLFLIQGLFEDRN